MLYLALFLLVGIPAAWSEECEYYKFSENHTMCEYPEDKPGEACGTDPLVCEGFTQEEKDVILATHNELRNKLAQGEIEGQPPASNMKELVWDDELATIAQRWAYQCKEGHEPNYKDRTSMKYDPVGQNYLGDIKKQPETIDELKVQIARWVNEEVGNMDDSYIDSFPDDDEVLKKVGHYSQVMWAETQAVGCGMVCYKNGDWININIVCDYGVGANMPGDKIYKRGPATTECSTKDAGAGPQPDAGTGTDGDSSQDEQTQERSEQYKELCPL